VDRQTLETRGQTMPTTALSAGYHNYHHYGAGGPRNICFNKTNLALIYVSFILLPQIVIFIYSRNSKFQL